MAARTNPDAVQSILGGNYDGETVLTRFITLAHLLVNRVNSCATARGVTLNSDELEHLEMLLAAHFYLMSDKAYQSRSTDGASGQFQGQTGMGLDSTDYGQQAKVLDTSGCLASFDKGRKAHFAWLGKPPSTQTDYINRD